MVVASIPAVQAFATRGCATRHLLDENPIEWGEAAAMLPRSGIGRRTGMAPRASAACALCAA
jgi:hypothetical protein